MVNQSSFTFSIANPHEISLENIYPLLNCEQCLQFLHWKKCTIEKKRTEQRMNERERRMRVTYTVHIASVEFAAVCWNILPKNVFRLLSSMFPKQFLCCINVGTFVVPLMIKILYWMRLQNSLLLLFPFQVYASLSLCEFNKLMFLS